MGSGNGLYGTAIVLLIIGGLNWALVGLFGFDLVAAIFGQMTVLSRIIYILVGISAIYVAIAEPQRIAEHRQIHMAHR
jgi:uncharacterized membrane protein YuzA (DUF378 family)